MSILTLVAADEDCDEIDRLRGQRDELLGALRIVAQSLAWVHWGESGGFHDHLEQAGDALCIARMVIDKAAGDGA